MMPLSFCNGFMTAYAKLWVRSGKNANQGDIVMRGTCIQGNILALLTVVMLTPPVSAATPWTGLKTEPLAQTCNYYENRARFLERGPDMALAALLADSCRIALHRFTDTIGTTPYEAKRARIYLERLTRYKDQIIAMNTESFAQARQRKPRQLGGTPRVQVSHAGEYLIARSMGVLSAYSDWARASGFVTAQGQD